MNEVTKFEVGQKWELLTNDHPYLRKGTVFPVESLTELGDVVFTDHTDKVYIVSCGRIEDNKVRLVSHRPFTKADLKDGMRVTYQCGDVRIVLDGALYNKCTGGRFDLIVSLHGFNDDLTTTMTGCTIVKVVERDGTVLFERQVKSADQLLMEKLEKQQRDIADQMAELSKRINK